jgi:ubiquitin carboxyl-terminal hydrolase 36/42
MAHRSPGADSTNENGSTRMGLLEVTKADGAGLLPAAIKNDVFISRGLTNTGNTCWLNSALQGVCSTPGLMQSVRLNPHSASCTASLDERAKCISCQLEHLLLYNPVVWPPSASAQPAAIAPRGISDNRRLLNENFRFDVQEDAHEGLVGLRAALQRECPPCVPAGAVAPVDGTTVAASVVPSTSPFSMLAGGSVKSTLTCACGHVSSKEDVCEDISLSIGGTGDTVAAALARYCQPEPLADECVLSFYLYADMHYYVTLLLTPR